MDPATAATVGTLAGAAAGFIVAHEGYRIGKERAKRRRRGSSALDKHMKSRTTRSKRSRSKKMKGEKTVTQSGLDKAGR